MMWAAFELAVWIGVPGWLWSCGRCKEDPPPFLLRCAAAVAIGLAGNLLIAVALASLGCWSPAWHMCVWGAWLLPGALRLHRYHRGNHSWTPLRQMGGFFGLLLLMVWLSGLVGGRSEWLAGGWDPGLYQNNAIAIARDGHLSGRAISVYTDMTPEERHDFVQALENNYHEYLPGAPLDMEDGSMPLYFFHLSPLCGAWFYRIGGFQLLHAMPSVLAGLCVLLFGGFFLLLGLTPLQRAAAFLFLLFSPVFWFQQALPTSEMLYLFLLLGALIFYIRDARAARPFSIATAAMIFAMPLNHLNSVILIAACLVVAAAAEGYLQIPGRLWRLGGSFLALAAGLAWDLHYAGITVWRLHEKEQLLWILVPACAVCAVIALALAWKPLPSVLKNAGSIAIRLGATMGCLLIILVAWTSAHGAIRGKWVQLGEVFPLFGLPVWWLLRITPFFGTWAVGLAAIGCILLAWNFKKKTLLLRFTTLALGGVVLLLLIKPGIARLFPWATRRYIVFLLPLMVLGEVYLFSALFSSTGKWRPVWRWVVIGIAGLPLLWEGATLGRRAMQVADYPGLTAVITAIADAACEGDIIVADDPEWGTPLAIVHGRDIINGKRLWDNPDPAARQRILSTLQRLNNQPGRRVLWLTGLESGLDLYNSGLTAAGEPLVDIPYTFTTIKHRERQRLYEDRSRTRRFRLYEWDGTFTLPPP